jgi:carbon-monoxide dehydrogenase medium subunit
MIGSHPGLPEFDYVKPVSLSEASRFLVEHSGQARLFMGGTDTFVRLRDGAWKAKFLVDVKQLPGMKMIGFDLENGLTIGAAVNLNQVAAFPAVQHYYPLLAEAAHSVASYQLRTRASLVGNICNSSPAGDTLGACLVFRGELQVFGPGGTRTEPLTSFFTGPGKNRLQTGDIITAIRFPLPPVGSKGTYVKLGRNNLGDLAIVGVTALGYPDTTSRSGFGFRLVLASVAPVPLEVTAAEAILSSEPINSSSFEAASEAAYTACNPIDDLRGSARYRKLMTRNLTRRALQNVWKELQPAGRPSSG